MKLSASKVREILLERRMTQIELADQAGLTRETIDAVCNDKGCSYRSALKIAYVLDVELDDIKR